MMEHPSEATLNELADGTLEGRERARAEAHLASCLSCASAVKRIAALTARARALPRDVPPPDGAWKEVRQAVLAGRRRQGAGNAAPRRRGMGVAIAAAALLVALSSATTFWLTHEGTPRESPARTVSEPPASLAEFAPVEARYVLATDALRQTLDERRELLDPATVRTVERSLATIDVAIAEARAALVRDPANAALSRLLASSYEQKVTLLRRASELPPRS
ncbi:MAG TPA: zf-HC2 domain-containing protein [Gemmatimonadaceae bacterium]|nr:zf-HC2 domain-containing protein [Gemmatimonadaceae bacterium]